MFSSSRISPPEVSFRNWLKWQLPYATFSYAYFPVTLTKRVLLKGKRGYRGLDPLARRFWDKWGFLSPSVVGFSQQRPIWINLNSGGEVVIGWALLKSLRAGQGPYLLSTESYDGHALLCREFGSDRTFFPPWDLRWPVERDLKRLAPRALVFVQNAYFPILLRRARRLGIKTVLVNGLFDRNVRQGNPSMQRALGLGFHHELDAIAVQTQQDYQVARSWGISPERLTVTGDLYADLGHLRLSKEERRTLRRQLGFEEDDQIFLVASTHAKEEAVVHQMLTFLRQKRPRLKFIVAPRQMVEVTGMFERLTEVGWRVAKRSHAMIPAQGNGLSEKDILLLDTFGELGRLYGIADAAYIGSSLVPLNERRAGHNILEPLVHGVVPVFGPHMGLWRHVVDPLLKIDPTLQIGSPEAAADRVLRILDGERASDAIQDLTESILQSQGGAVEKTCAWLKHWLAGE